MVFGLSWWILNIQLFVSNSFFRMRDSLFFFFKFAVVKWPK